MVSLLGMMSLLGVMSLGRSFVMVLLSSSRGSLLSVVMLLSSSRGSRAALNYASQMVEHFGIISDLTLARFVLSLSNGESIRIQASTGSHCECCAQAKVRFVSPTKLRLKTYIDCVCEKG